MDKFIVAMFIFLGCAPIALAGLLSWDVVRIYRFANKNLSFTSKCLIGIMFLWAFICTACVISFAVILVS